MSTEEILNRIEKDLSKLDFECLFVEETEESEAVVSVHLGMDDAENDLVLVITALEQFPMEEGETPHYIVSFTVPFPYEIAEDNITEVLWTINLLNSTIDMPGYILSYEELKIYYTYSWTTAAQYDSEILDIICANVMLSSVSFSKMLSAVASGEATYEQVLDAMNVFSNVSQNEFQQMLGSLADEDDEDENIIDGKIIEEKIKKIKKKKD